MKFELADSRLIRGILFLAHGIAGLMVAAAGLPPSFKLALAGVLTVSGLFYLRRSRERAYLEIAEDGFCLLQINTAPAVECRLLPRSFVASYLVVLHLRYAAGAEYVVITPDRLDSRTFRRLRVFLRWGLRLDQH